MKQKYIRIVTIVVLQGSCFRKVPNLLFVIVHAACLTEFKIKITVTNVEGKRLMFGGQLHWAATVPFRCGVGSVDIEVVKWGTFVYFPRSRSFLLLTQTFRSVGSRGSSFIISHLSRYGGPQHVCICICMGCR